VWCATWPHHAPVKASMRYMGPLPCNQGHLQHSPALLLCLLLLQDDRVVSGDTPEKTFENTVTALKQQIKFSPDEVCQERCVLQANFTCTAAAHPHAQALVESVQCSLLWRLCIVQCSLPWHTAGRLGCAAGYARIPCASSPDHALLCCAARSCPAS
jgi:hypothetical protein